MASCVSFVLVRYFHLSTFFWMFIEGKLQKEQARKMFENSQKLSHLNFHAQKMYSFSWPKLQLHIMILIFGAKFKISLI